MSLVSCDVHRWIVVPDRAAPAPERELVGGKAWSLWRMSSLGLRVPPAFVVTTAACSVYFESGCRLPDGLDEELRLGIDRLESELGRRLGDERRPLLVSVRSGAAISMPGMMDTILNLGMNATTEQALAAETGSSVFAAEVHRRFCAMYGRLVLGCLEDLDDLPSADVVRAAISDDVGDAIPEDPWQQLHAAVAAVFASSRSRRAVAYREHHGIPAELGTAVTVQAMVFGNVDDQSGTGVLFTRDPATGARRTYGEYLPRGQGEEVVSGRVTPEPLERLAADEPAAHAELMAAASKLEVAGRDAQDIEFTVQSGELFLLQSRPAKRSARAAVQIAVDLQAEGLLTVREALDRVTPAQVRCLLRPQLVAGPADSAELLARGAPAGPGVATGVVVDTPEAAQRSPGSVLVRPTTSPEDIHGILAAVAVVTEVGGATSHAAVVSRALDLPCVVGCGAGVSARLTGKTVTVDGDSGRIFAGALPTASVDADKDPQLLTLGEWARDVSPVAVVAERDADPSLIQAAFAADEPARSLPHGTSAVRGRWFATAEGVAAAVAAKVQTVITPYPLPVLLEIVRMLG